MKFKVRIQSAKLTKIGNQDAVTVHAVSQETPGEVTVTVPIALADDFKVGQIVQAEVRVRRSDE